MQRHPSSSRASSFSSCYRPLSPSSQVDDDDILFGSPDPISSQLCEDDPCEEAPSKIKKDKDTIQIISKDLIRNLRIPLNSPSGKSVFLPSAKYKRIILASQANLKEEREAFHQAYQRKEGEETKAAEERKQQIQAADLSRKNNKALTELEREARKRSQDLLEQSNALRMEQEEEIKRLNRLILNAQCQATINAQLEEKKQIQAEMEEEGRRLDAVMEAERQKGLETERKIDELRKQHRNEGRAQLLEQIQKHLEEKENERKMREQEKQQIKENQKKMEKDDLKAKEKNRMEQQRMQEEIMRINAETLRVKEQRMKEEKLADIKAMEYIKKKQAMDAEREAEQKRIRKEKEMEIAKLRAQHEKDRNYKAEQDELCAHRHQEELQKKWREKNREQAARKAQQEAMLGAARLEQVHSKQHYQTVQATIKKEEFDRMLKAQKEAEAKEKEQQERQRQKALRHAEAVRQQVNERKKLAKAEHRERFGEADKLLKEAQQRQMLLNEIKEKKLKELRVIGLGEKYCCEVERKAQRTHFV
ncbi:cilia- and flagella-associated protein 45 isoform X1 [Haplochromis burtoni]|uniref:Cilia- and flagella-associated protein 45 n=1 Tax=Haplochromis burtoni TaxID=8153 RepID=A0A3Q2VER8_HAPBU|nr:cilia- and flagella-associated protein 45 isoform X1 [Haplochromis burtoni]